MPVEVETLSADGKPAAYVIRGQTGPDETVFPTSADLTLQVGFVGRAQGQAVEPHVHHAVERTIRGTAEVLMVLSGRCHLDIFDSARAQVQTTTMSSGDVVLLVSGGHGFRMIEDTVLLEVKQGPYRGLSEKERFVPA